MVALCRVAEATWKKAESRMTNDLAAASRRTVFTVLEETAAAYPERAALHQPTGGGKYRSWTWREYRDSVQQIAVGLREIGVSVSDIVALQSETRAEFYLADMGVMAAGATAAALYTSLPFGDQAETLRASGARVVLVENAKAMSALQSAAGDAPLEVRWILLTGNAEDVLTLEQVRALGEQRMRDDPDAFARIRAEVRPDTTAVLYMTSGATGEPKMGLVTHRALVANMDHAPFVLPLTPEDVTIAFLPSAHIAQRVVVQLVPVRQGSEVWFSEGVSKLPTEIRTIRPTFFLAPARVGAGLFDHHDRNPQAPRRSAEAFLSWTWRRITGQRSSPGRPAGSRVVANLLAVFRPRRVQENPRKAGWANSNRGVRRGSAWQRAGRVLCSHRNAADRRLRLD